MFRLIRILLLFLLRTDPDPTSPSAQDGSGSVFSGLIWIVPLTSKDGSFSCIGWICIVLLRMDPDPSSPSTQDDSGSFLAEDESGSFCSGSIRLLLLRMDSDPSALHESG